MSTIIILNHNNKSCLIKPETLKKVHGVSSDLMLSLMASRHTVYGRQNYKVCPLNILYFNQSNTYRWFTHGVENSASRRKLAK